MNPAAFKDLETGYIITRINETTAIKGKNTNMSTIDEITRDITIRIILITNGYS